MKRVYMLFFFIICFCSISRITLAASVGSIVGQPIDMQRSEMEEYFDKGRDEDALALAEQLVKRGDVNSQVYLYTLMLERVEKEFNSSAYSIAELLAQVGYKDSMNYYLYFSSIALIDEGKYQEAMSNFQSLPDGFLKAKAYYEYAKGRMYEDNQKYDKALENFEEANKLDIIPELSSHIKLCNAILMQDKYNKAVALYNEGNLEASLVIFMEIDPYEDSMLYIDKISNTNITDEESVIFTISKITKTSAEAAWNDFSDTGYVVTYGPAANIKALNTLETDTNSILLNDLIPGIFYKIMVCSKGNAQEMHSEVFSAGNANVDSGINVAIAKIDVKRYSLADASNGDALNLLVSQGDRLYALDNNTIYLPGTSLSKSGVGYLARVLIKDYAIDNSTSAKVQFVLKTSDEKYFCDSAQIQLGYTIYDPINSLLDSYYVDNGNTWGEATATVTIYINGDYLGETSFILSTKAE